MPAVIVHTDLVLQSFNNGVHSVLALKNAKVGEFNGRTLSTVSQTTITMDPDVPEAGHLRHWYFNFSIACSPNITSSFALTGRSAAVSGIVSHIFLACDELLVAEEWLGTTELWFRNAAAHMQLA